MEEIHISAFRSHALLPAVAHGSGSRPSLVFSSRVLAAVVLVVTVSRVCIVVTVGRFVPGVRASFLCIHAVARGGSEPMASVLTRRNIAIAPLLHCSDTRMGIILTHKQSCKLAIPRQHRSEGQQLTHSPVGYWVAAVCSLVTADEATGGSGGVEGGR